MSDGSTQGIKTVLHPVSDLEAVYTALLGLPSQADSSYYVGFDVAGQHIGPVPDGGPQRMESPVAYWHVPDIEAKLAEVTAAAGATAKEAAQDVGGGALGGDRDRSRREHLLQDKRRALRRAPALQEGTDEQGHRRPAHATDSHDLIRVHGARENTPQGRLERWVQTCRRELLDRTLI
ncbi:VOC family protein [Actinomadura napierensis]|uniref:Uncharacterized protein n=1 Tax=Actinomadura napierensis TaxID=267854 RepID=A0ABP5K8D7_9ACTN